MSCREIRKLTASLLELDSSISFCLLYLGLYFLHLHHLSSLDQHLKTVSFEVMKRNNASFMHAQEEQQWWRKASTKWRGTNISLMVLAKWIWKICRINVSSLSTLQLLKFLFSCLAFFPPLKTILNMPCGFISSSSRKCSFPGNNISLSSLWLSYNQEAWGKRWFGNLLSQNGRICFLWRVVRIISKPRGQWDPETCGTLLNISLGSSLWTILRAYFLWLTFLEIWSEKRNKINK